MKKYTFVALMLSTILIVSLALTSLYVKKEQTEEQDGNLVIVTSFYPMYIAAMNLLGDTEGITLKNLSEPQTGCLHDFQLTPEDMKLLSGADIFLINGGGIESFMEEVASAYPELKVIEACKDVSLLEEDDEDSDESDEEQDLEAEEFHEEHAGEEGHDHGDANAHAWMSISDYRTMVVTLASGLADADQAHADFYAANASVYDKKLEELDFRQQELTAPSTPIKVILFHEAYAYTARDMGFETVFTMDLDEERQVSAGEVASVLSAITDQGASMILAEELYGADMAATVTAEADVKVVFLDPLTRGEYQADSYLQGMAENLNRLEDAMKTRTEK